MRQIAVSGPPAQLPQHAITYEWLSTNGLGGFASGTVAGINTRRYHAVLLAAPRLENRFVLLAQLHEEVWQGDRYWALGATYYPDVIHPHGYTHLQRFTLYPYPTWVYAAGDWIIQKQLTMVKGANTTVVRYRLLAGDGQSLRLVIRPLFAGRDYHATHRAAPDSFHVDRKDHWVIVSSSAGVPATWLGYSAGEFLPEPDWYKTVRYPAETTRGLDDEEDLFSPGRIMVTGWDNEFYLVVTADEPNLAELAGSCIAVYGQDAFAHVVDDQKRLLAKAQQPTGIVANLVLAADAYVIRRNESTSIIAGYPWFTDWGRDTMIALPGLLLATGRTEEALSTLMTFAAAAKDGLIPNRFPDRHTTPEYNTVDAALWFIYACERYFRYTNSPADLEPILPVVKSIITGYLAGTRYNIRVDNRGLVHAGEAGTQLTWMDAKVGDWVVTPRQGFPIEISALWYNALRSTAALCSHLDEQFSAFCYEQAVLTKQHFAATFWDEKRGYLADVIDDAGQADHSLRPNQLFAMSLPYSVFTGNDAARAVRKVWQELYTPLGIRSLAPSDAKYRGVYQGDQWQRDGAYHQGTVWAWLMGPFISAYLKTHGAGQQQLHQARILLAPLLDHLGQAGLGHVSEIFSGDSPHFPVGCPAQAWSVAELLRLWVEEFQRAPLESDLL